MRLHLAYGKTIFAGRSNVTKVRLEDGTRRCAFRRRGASARTRSLAGRSYGIEPGAL
jgi:hypothetical protein